MSAQVLRVASNQKVTLNQKLMFLGHLQVLFYARPPNSQLLFSKPGNTPLLLDFDKPPGPLDKVKSKKFIKPKMNVSGAPSSSVLYKTPKFPTFIQQTWKWTPFSGFWRAHRASGVCIVSKSCIKPKVNVSGSPSSLVKCKTPEFPTLI